MTVGQAPRASLPSYSWKEALRFGGAAGCLFQSGWTRSCTSLQVVYPNIHRVSSIPTDAGVSPPTVWVRLILRESFVGWLTRRKPTEKEEEQNNMLFLFLGEGLLA